MGPHPRRPARAAGARARRVLGGAQGRADPVGVQAAQGRHLPRRQPVQRGRGDLLLRVDQEEGRAALRSLRLRAGRLPGRLPGGGHQDRRPHRRVRDQQADQLRALPDLLHGHRVAHPVAEVQGLAQVRRAAVRHRSLPGDQVRAARAARAGGLQGLLGRQAPPQDRQAGAAADAGADHPAGRAAQRPGRLDRGAAARRDPPAQGGRLHHRAQQLPAQLDPHPAARQGAVEQQAGAEGGQLRDRSRRHLQEPAERHLHPGHRRGLQGPPLVRQAQGDLRLQPGEGQGPAAPGRVRREPSTPRRRCT